MNRGGVTVRLLGPDADERHGQSVMLRLVDNKWVILGLGQWILDEDLNLLVEGSIPSGLTTFPLNH